MARTARKPAANASYSDASETESEAAVTPRPRQKAARLKRRVSQYNPQEDESQQLSNPGDSFRIPLKPINDEVAEKRNLKRRKSRMSMGIGLEAGSLVADDEATHGASQDINGDAETQKTPKKTALARANQLKSITAPAPVAAPIEILSSNFEEWMKMATDNKINATNSWSFALIDYFHDMSLLRNDTDNSINFQKASRTLDGCVKIWTSRVDSVGTDTGKLLSNLAEEGRPTAGEGEEDEEGEGGEGAKKKKATRTEATLAKTATQLHTKKLELEFAVDPLFKKTSEDFDEGGAQGLLMNHLAVDNNLRVVFDASDTPGGADEDEPEEAVTILVPLDALRTKLDLENIAEKSVMSSRLADFKFSSDPANNDYSIDGAFRSRGEEMDSADEAEFQDPIQVDMNGDYGDGGDGAGPLPAPGGTEDFFSGDQAIEDYPLDFGGDGYDQGGEDGETGEDGRETRAGAPLAPFDPRHAPNPTELVMAMANTGGQDMLDYFDASVIKNWAGPEHWKMRKVIRKVTTAEPTAPKPRKEKQAFQIDFSRVLTAEEERKMIEPPAKAGLLSLPAKQCAYIGGKKNKKAAEKREEKLLPDDMHFSSRQLLSLFLKPRFTLKMRGHRTSLQVDNSDEVDEHFWARAAADQGQASGEGIDATQGGGAVPFNTQFFQDDDDFGGGFGGGFDDAYDGGEGGGAPVVGEDEDLQAAAQGQVRRIRPEFVNYAKRVKRVDVRRLKDTIWKELDIVVPPQDEEEAPSSHTPTDPNDARQFTQVISGLRRSYPKEKMEEISTSFCFICLLHLANERGLKIEPDADGAASPRMGIDSDDEDYPVGKKVGDIWGLKIYRDPDATPSA